MRSELERVRVSMGYASCRIVVWFQLFFWVKFAYVKIHFRLKNGYKGRAPSHSSFITFVNQLLYAMCYGRRKKTNVCHLELFV